MRLLQKLLKKPSIAPGIVAISFLPNGFAIAVTRYSAQNRPYLIHCEFIAGSTLQNQSQLETLVKEFKLEDYDCHILLSPEQYRSISIETPAVSNEELKSAINWRIAEFLDYPVDQANIDYYPLPKSNRPNRTPMLEVVSCARQLVLNFAEQCRQLGLNLKVIDIQETALRNLATLLRESQQGIALLYLQKDAGRIIVQKAGELYLSRKIATGYLQLSENSLIYDEHQLNLEQDSLALEIQRSLDYVENYFDIPPITSLATVLMPIDNQKIINFLNVNHGITTHALDISAVIDGDILLNDATQNECAPVIGASLRKFLEESGQS